MKVYNVEYDVYALNTVMKLYNVEYDVYALNTVMKVYNVEYDVYALNTLSAGLHYFSSPGTAISYIDMSLLTGSPDLIKRVPSLITHLQLSTLLVSAATHIHHMDQNISIGEVIQEGVATPSTLVGTRD
jgi:hypothetical protein